MDLLELKKQWQVLSEEANKQKGISRSIVVQMTRINYRNRLAKMVIPEVAGTIICLLAVIYILGYFADLNTRPLRICGAITIVILTLLPLLSMKSAMLLLSVDISLYNYKDSIKIFTQRKMTFLRLQKWSFYISAVLLLVIFPVLGKLIGGKDLFATHQLWFGYIIIYPFYYAYAKWVFKRNAKTALDAQELLADLDSD